jgi:Zn-dependent protease
MGATLSVPVPCLSDMARFRALGVPVQVDPWFLLGLVFVYTWAGGDRVGLFAAISLGALTLVHELGHALTARRFGCDVAISLNLFVGWASYSARRPLGRAQRIGISLMGPFSQLAIALAGIAVAHAMIRRSSDPQLWFEIGLGLSWAGVVIAGLNLLPLWPLDGGHVVHTVLESLLPPARALRAVLLVSFAGIATMLVVGIAAGEATGGVLLAERRRPAEAAFLLANGTLPEALWAQIRALPAYLLDIPWFLLVFSGLASVQAWQRLRSGPGPRDEPDVAGAAPPDLVRVQPR